MDDTIKTKETSSDESKMSQKLDLSKLNTVLTISLKVVLLGAIITTFIAGKSIYEQYAHYGPSCSDNISSFQYWSDNAKNAKGKIVSVHKSRLQTENGTTQCYGKFSLEDGSYRNWNGSISELANKDVVGWTKVSE
ncbi:hypothetical protein A1OS_23605 [Enterovibrio norvegicus]|uniref:hypothetical protein n=1 Tax=Vibrionaceae TaxID=641 RepID=UPI0002E7D0C0|nr:MULTISPECIES: hypothetical protein [Vibrionaceae]MUJ26344.1 hypothetical protein [Aliivibrio fischeri]OEE48904.1 hypothetical protein A1OS_23605 [Enterovibrio norvegicus]OEF28231.1 hypothetical protein OA9_12620 [Vibrio cyclitrophicus 1F97]PML75628.1 hypothetical protein BCT71_22005 [Vibrio sp. 10N.261.51.A7]TKG09937.1 hypothetical protein FCV67_05600 [Vibrio sp. F13]